MHHCSCFLADSEMQEILPSSGIPVALKGIDVPYDPSDYDDGSRQSEGASVNTSNHLRRV